MSVPPSFPVPPVPPVAVVMGGPPGLDVAPSPFARVARMLLAAFVILLMTLSGLLLVATVGSATGILGFLIGLCLALLPLPLVLGAFRWLDRYEPEPPALLAFTFFWGATVAALVSGTLNTVGGMILAGGSAAPEEVAADGLVATAVYVAPWVEEAAKGAALLAIFFFRRRELNGIVDGIVFAGMVGIGFAFTENILYFGRAFLAGSTELGTAGGIMAVGITFVLRGVFSPFAHPFFTVLTGIGLGLAVSARQQWVRWTAPPVGFLGAVLLHWAWNRSAVQGLEGFIVSYVGIMVPAFLVLIAVAVWSRRREGRVVADQLPAYVRAGWLAPEDVAMVSSLPVRRQALRWAGGRYGDPARRALRNFQHAATELAFLREQAERGHVDASFAAREHDLLRTLALTRAAVAPQRLV